MDSNEILQHSKINRSSEVTAKTLDKIIKNIDYNKPDVQTFHPSWNKDLPDEVSKHNAAISFLRKLPPGDFTPEAIAFFFAHLRLGLNKTDKNDFDVLFDYINNPDNIVISINNHPTLYKPFCDNIATKFNNYNKVTKEFDTLKDFIWKYSSPEIFLKNISPSDAIKRKLQLFLDADPEFANLSSKEKEKIIRLAKYSSYYIDDIIYKNTINDVNLILLSAHLMSNKNTPLERFLGLKNIRYEPYCYVIDRAKHYCQENGVYFKKLKEYMCDLEFLGMNKIRKNDKVYLEDIEILNSSLPSAKLNISHKIDGDHHVLVFSEDGITFFEIEVSVLEGMLLVYDLDAIEENRDRIKKYLKSSIPIAIKSVIHSMCKNSGMILHPSSQAILESL